MKPILILDQHFRKRDELFRPDVFDALAQVCDVRGGVDEPMPRSQITALLPEATFYVAAHPVLSAAEVQTAKNLKATIEVSGAFREGLDYDACFARNIEVLSCSPGFRNAVAEMALSMMLAAGRGLIEEHEAFRKGIERWLDDREDRDFTLYNQTIGFIGYGEISRQTHHLLRPFAPRVLAYDPYVSDSDSDVEFTDLETLVGECRVVVVAAVPSEETKGLLSARLIEQMTPGAVVVLISRAWCADFSALVTAAEAGRITLATDVYPDEPLPPGDALRRYPHVILSPHRAAAVPGGRQLIGEMILHDVRAILSGDPARQLKAASPEMLAGLVAAQNQMKAMPNT